MSYARKCDRCGICFDPNAGKSLKMENVRTISPQEYRQNTCTYVGSFLGDDSRTMDLCPACTDDFLCFLEFKKDSAPMVMVPNCSYSSHCSQQGALDCMNCTFYKEGSTYDAEEDEEL